MAYSGVNHLYLLLEMISYKKTTIFISVLQFRLIIFANYHKSDPLNDTEVI